MGTAIKHPVPNAELLTICLSDVRLQTNRLLAAILLALLLSLLMLAVERMNGSSSDKSLKLLWLCLRRSVVDVYPELPIEQRLEAPDPASDLNETLIWPGVLACGDVGTACLRAKRLPMLGERYTLCESVSASVDMEFRKCCNLVSPVESRKYLLLGMSPLDVERYREFSTKQSLELRARAPDLRRPTSSAPSCKEITVFRCSELSLVFAELREREPVLHGLKNVDNFFLIFFNWFSRSDSLKLLRLDR